MGKFLGESFGEGKEKRSKDTAFIIPVLLLLLLFFQHLSGMKQILKIRDLAKENILKVFYFKCTHWYPWYF